MRKILYIILLFIFAFTFTGGPPQGWYQQTLPDIGNRPISDMTFADSLNGWIITPYVNENDSAFILKTTNGGDNWLKQRTDAGQFVGFTKIQFLNPDTGFVTGVFLLDKTTNGGQSWIPLNIPKNLEFEDMHVLNSDTIWLADNNGLTGGIYRTTNGGNNWTQQFYQLNQNPDKVYFFNKDLGFISANNRTFRTSNGGDNWTQVLTEGYTDIKFIDPLTGWKARQSIKKSTDGGLTWISQSTPSGGMIADNSILELSVLDDDTLWGVGGQIRFGIGNVRGIVWKTTNGGMNWGYQIPDTTFHIPIYYNISQANSGNIWSYSLNGLGVHTKTGGSDTTFFTGIEQINTVIPSFFELSQNFPNPFNPTTSMKFKVKSTTNVKLTIFDMKGVEIAVLVNEKLSAGEYEYLFDGSGLSTGVYFYQLKAGGFIDTKKMLMIK